MLVQLTVCSTCAQASSREHRNDESPGQPIRHFTPIPTTLYFRSLDRIEADQLVGSLVLMPMRTIMHISCEIVPHIIRKLLKNILVLSKVFLLISVKESFSPSCFLIYLGLHS